MTPVSEAPPLEPDTRAILWRAALKEVGPSIGVVADPDALSDGQVVEIGEATALTLLGPLADVAGQLAFRAVAAYREAQAEARYPDDEAGSPA